MNLQDLENELRLEFKHYHVGAQFIRFVSVFASTMLLQMFTGGFHVSGWAALGSFLLSTVVVAARQVWPSLPWDVVLGVLRAHADTGAVATPVPPSAVKE